VTIPRAEHQPVIAEPNGTAIEIDCRVSHIEGGQMKAASR
jgi:hypothetical protein